LPGAHCFVGHAGPDISSTTPANIPIIPPTTTAGAEEAPGLRNGHFALLRAVREILDAHRHSTRDQRRPADSRSIGVLAAGGWLAGQD
jgi:hypothetical protein